MAKKELNYIFENPNSSEETKQLLRDIGFDCVYELDGGFFKKRFL